MMEEANRSVGIVAEENEDNLVVAEDGSEDAEHLLAAGAEGGDAGGDKKVKKKKKKSGSGSVRKERDGSKKPKKKKERSKSKAPVPSLDLELNADSATTTPSHTDAEDDEEEDDDDAFLPRRSISVDGKPPPSVLRSFCGPLSFFAPRTKSGGVGRRGNIHGRGHTELPLF